MTILRSVAACAAAMLFVATAHAAGLGRLTVNSALGQPLNAEIDLLSLQPGEADAMAARVSPPEAFQDARIEYSSALRLLRFSVEKRANGQPYLKVTSIGPINEPFLDLLIEVSWPAGKIQREYPILLDPPGYAQGRVAPLVTAAPAPRTAETPPAAMPAAPSVATVTPSTAPSGSPSASAEMPAPTGVVSEPTSDTYGPVQRGETLRKIADQVKPESVSMDQMLVALYRENKGAFAGNNMNRLKTGQILKVPSAEDISQIQASEARQEIRTHVADWKSYRDNLAGGVASMPARDSSAGSSGRIGSASVESPPPPSAGSSDVLKLSKSEAGKAGGGTSAKGGAASQDRINALQEELTAKDKALKEAQSRVSDLEKQIRDMQRLVELKAGAPAKPGEAPKVAAAPAKPEPAKPEAAKPEPPKPEPAKPAEPPKVAAVTPSEPPKPAEPAKPTEAAKPAEAPKTTEAPKTAEAKPAAPKEAPKAAPKKAAPPPEKSFVDEMLDNPIYLAIGGALVGGIALGAFLFVRRRKARAEAGPTSSMTSAFPSDLKPNTTTGKAGGGLVDTGNSSFLTDFDKTGPGTIDTDEVDPVAEAEVYIAYGRDTQAEEILKEAMARGNAKPEVALKLLEIYHARKSATAFETVAKDLHAQVGESSPLWQKAASMGAQIDPGNSLYAAGVGGTATYTAAAPAEKPDVDFDIAKTTDTAPAPSFDLDLDKSASSAAPAPDLPVESSHTMDFDITGGGGAPAAAPAHEPPKEEKPSFDFDLSGLDMGGGAKPAPKAEPAPSSGGMSMDLADLSLDSGGGGGATSGEAVGTKLELAKAYLEIGDKDGARDILQEVAREGSSEQQEEAKKLIASL